MASRAVQKVQARGTAHSHTVQSRVDYVDLLRIHSGSAHARPPKSESRDLGWIRSRHDAPAAGVEVAKRGCTGIAA